METAENLVNLERKLDVDLVSAPDDSDSRTKERTDVLLRLYQENGQRLRHYEEQRSTVGHIIIVGTVGLIALIRHLDHEDWPLTLAIAFMGVFGAGFTCIYFWLVKGCEQTARKYHEKLDAQLFGDDTLQNLQTNVFGKTSSNLRNWFVKYWPLAITIIAVGFTWWAHELPPTPLSDQDRHPPFSSLGQPENKTPCTQPKGETS
jgi:hypothetical protein